jgi:hypothetical protein
MFRRRRSAKDFAEEIQAHLELETDELRNEGQVESSHWKSVNAMRFRGVTLLVAPLRAKHTPKIGRFRDPERPKYSPINGYVPFKKGPRIVPVRAVGD